VLIHPLAVITPSDSRVNPARLVDSPVFQATEGRVGSSRSKWTWYVPSPDSTMKSKKTIRFQMGWGLTTGSLAS
jgi:hypothetical protein